MPRSPAGERGPGECPVALVAMHVGLLLASGAATSRRAPVVAPMALLVCGLLALQPVTDGLVKCRFSSIN